MTKVVAVQVLVVAATGAVCAVMITALQSSRGAAREISQSYEQTIVLTLGPLLLDRQRATAEVDGREPGLTATEFALLGTLIENHDRALGRGELLKEVWGHDFDPNTNVVELSVVKRFLRISCCSRQHP